MQNEEGKALEKRKFLYSLVGIVLLMTLCFNSVKTNINPVMVPKWSSKFRPQGGYVNKVHFMIHTNEDSGMVALQKGDIDAYDERVLEEYLAGLVRNPNIEVTFTPSVRYRVLTLNCERFPLNITAFRRAMAFGFDKYRTNVECIGGIGIPQDSQIPSIATEWEIENSIVNHYYEPDYVSGNASLENAGFTDLDDDGWREYDKNKNRIWDPGIDLDNDEYAEGGIIELYATGGYDPAIRACDIMVDGLEAMGIMAETVELDFADFWALNELWAGRAWVLCWTEGISIINPSQLLYDNFRTGGRYNSYPYNYYHFSNATIDQLLDHMVNSTTLEDTKMYAKEAATLLAFEQPQIVCYNDVNINAYRTDKFDGFFEFKGLGTSSKDNPYVAIKVHRKESEGGPYGGTLKYCLSGKLKTTNPYLDLTSYDETVFQYIYETLWNIDPFSWDPIPGLAYQWEIEPVTADEDVREGQKFTFYLYENETWHDGEPFNAADIYNSIFLWKNSTESGPKMADVYKIVMPDGPEGHIIEIFVNETSYLEWIDTTRFHITPEHIWRNVENVTAYSPRIGDVIGTGPYKMTAWQPGTSITLERHEDWRWDNRTIVDYFPTTLFEQSTTSTSGSTRISLIHSSIPLNSPILDPHLIFQIAGFGVILLFVITAIIIIRRYQLK